MQLITSLPTIVHAYWLLAKWDWRISNQPYKKWKKYLDKSFSVSNTSNQFDAYPQHKYLQQAILFAKVTRHHYRPMNCLRRCLALQELLLSKNMPSTLHIGVRFTTPNPSQSPTIEPSTGKTLQAHSWLTINGFIINDSKEVVSTYTEITNKSQFFQTSISSL
ncbi:lasso peptide biosynthesis B2 protein [Aliiglaciecola sp. 2_MG-2023]|uniref:lasso peptide biosynthesis B2 protein n=1 Tax=unclassified Aliiglaciecola TaxID=2593648 RepID=UPI0026E31D5A|nr:MULTISPECIES: lasso peptide biosynthesis B2 protein [unclassified Aliiglaciecola]MDO6712893.1 lasso peptide biosynthesis B2 protein [Aliiglaciecola sp. 2_MG-2023]MDO6752871.1 lasso peptide biosynthesis B2 protein [Aliiglaciecola sp. 1_MG-2023]